MYKSYQLRSCLMLILVLVISTLLMRLSDPKTSYLYTTAAHTGFITFSILGCWLIQAYVKINAPAKWPATTSAIMSLALGMVITLAVRYLFGVIVPKQFLFEDMLPRRDAADLLKQILGSFFLSMICYVIFNNQFTQQILQKTRLENAQLKRAHLEAQLIALQQQLSPHFLFNSLSTLKTIAVDHDTKNFIMQLSRVYRYLLTNTERQVAPLADEIEFVKAYLYIQEQRFDNALHISLHIPDEYMDALIPPLSLQLLVENAIKHNAFSREEPLLVAINVNNQHQLVVSNSYRPKKSTVESTGLGLQNIKERFQLLFGKGIVIDKLHDTFTVKLPLTNSI
ncbi:sensor histidine kinase [Mucilaginibacter conchicola]|uniref:Sensor histidine kinase n=1 Tax=Mucilaginibacter conchicola TaxID=2303333 RepID=A0A372NSQ1_9SPHI|nr:histidine kinase [Mucilaginibacter conchicola]RFZ92310.1 sensor histidine kinase [Mucilaginibacter conchicola]